MSRVAVIPFPAWIATVALFAACRPGEGQRCICEGECRRGLVCAQGGRMLEKNECIDPDDRTAAECVETEQDTLPDMADEGVMGPDVIFHDVGGKRDFEPGRPTDIDDGSAEASATASGTGGTTSTTSASESTTTIDASSSGSGTSTTAPSSSTGVQ